MFSAVHKNATKFLNIMRQSACNHAWLSVRSVEFNYG